MPFFFRFLNAVDLLVLSDLGCGAGDFLIPLLDEFPGVRALGLDIETELIQQV